MKWHRIFIWLLGGAVVLLIVTIGSFACSLVAKSNCREQLKGIRKMVDTTVLDYGDYEVMLPPCTYCPGDDIRYIFAVPEDNTIGTNELDNAITLLEFKNDEELKQSIVKKDFMEMVTGPFEFRFLPVWSSKEIAYSQSKGFLLVNIPDKKVEIHTISPGLYSGEIENVAVLDKGTRTFVIEVLKSRGNQEGAIWHEKLLQIINFENDTFTVIAEYPAGVKVSGYSEPWFVHNKKIFIFNDSTTKLEAFDERFQPTSHPLTGAFNQNRGAFRRLREIVIHPFLPFAIVIEMGKGPDLSKFDSLPMAARISAITSLSDDISRTTLFLYRWETSDSEQIFVPLLSSAGSIWQSYNPENSYSDFTFSPDGKWLVFKDQSYDYKNPIFVAVPILDKNPLYLGKPVKLGNAMRSDAIGPTGTAWTTNPTAFVMCDGMVLYRWNLDKYRTIPKVKMPASAPDPFARKGE